MTESRPVTPEEWAAIQRRYGGNPARWDSDVTMIPVDHDPFEQPWYSKVASGVGNALQGLSLTGMAHGAYDAAKNMVTYPGDVLTGKKSYSTEDATKWGADTAGLLGARGLAMPSEGVGVFAGKNAANADIRGLTDAMVENWGKRPPATVAEASALPYREGQWFQGPDKKWRFEIPDGSSKLTPDKFAAADKMGYGAKVGQLQDLLEHPELYKAYPELAKLETIVHRPGTLPRNVGGYYDLDARKIGLNGALAEDNIQSVLLHEIQHGIQKIEDFPMGATPKHPTFEQLQRDHPRFAELEDLRSRIWEARSKFGSAFEKHPMQRELQAKLSELHKEVGNLPQDLYNRTAGEAEARNVQTRFVNSDSNSRANSVGSLMRQMAPERFGPAPDSASWQLFNGKVPHPLATLDVDPQKLLHLDQLTGVATPLDPRFDIYGKAIR